MHSFQVFKINHISLFSTLEGFSVELRCAATGGNSLVHDHCPSILRADRAGAWLGAGPGAGLQ